MSKSISFTVEVTCIKIEEFINELNKKSINIRRVRKTTVVDYILQVEETKYDEFCSIAEEYGAKVSMLHGNNMYRMRKKLLNRKAFILGLSIFIAIIYYMSTKIWVININTDAFVSPYEIRTYLNTIGVKEGISKKNVDVFKLEKKIPEANSNVVWVRARITGTQLEINISERQNPPNIIEDTSPCDLIAKKDGIINRIYTLSGTAAVKEGDLIKQGDILIKGEQGKEETIYEVKAQGMVMATTFYESMLDFKIEQYKRVRTGNVIRNKYININKNKIYIKNKLNKYDKYDKIEDNNGIIKSEVYYEIKEIEYTEKEIEKLLEEKLIDMYSNIVIDFNHDVKVIDKLQEKNKLGDVYKLRVLITTEENIAVSD